MQSLGVLLLLFVALAAAKQGFGPGEQDWGYVEVRKGAHMFWWLYHTTATVKPETRPLLLWLQGGPGASSTGFGNFGEFGPLDENQNPRNYTWVKDANVIFVDNPVGSGYSYVDRSSLLTTNNAEIGADLVSLMKEFYKQFPEWTSKEFYITSESYGGKMAAEFAHQLSVAVKAGEIECNLKGVVLIDAWNSPLDSVMGWAPFLLHAGAVDTDGYNTIMNSAQKVKTAIANGQWAAATNYWSQTEMVIMSVAHNVDFYNILERIRGFGKNIRSKKTIGQLPSKGELLKQKLSYNDSYICCEKTSSRTDFQRIFNTESNQTVAAEGLNFPSPNEELIENLMNGAVKRALNIPLLVRWGGQQSQVFATLESDFMRPNTDVVEKLLDETNVKVFVLSGQLDLIVETIGTTIWVENLKWKGSNGYKSAPRKALTYKGYNEGYSKEYENFGMFWINRSGHMVPADNPWAMAAILEKLTNNYNQK